MWSLRKRLDNSTYLTYDSNRRPGYTIRGAWDLIGPQENEYTKFCVKKNEEQGLLCCNDDEGNVRVLVLE